MHTMTRLTITFAALAFAGCAAAITDPRYCGPPARDADGTIHRSTAVRASFVRLYPCPSTGEVSGACPGWAVDHVIPLSVGGCDAVGNMAWMPLAIKSCSAKSGVPCKDRWERDVYRRRDLPQKEASRIQ